MIQCRCINTSVDFDMIHNMWLLMAILFLADYVGAEGKGVVKGVMGDDEPWPEEGKVKYKHYLECDHRHEFPNDDWTYTYDIHCIQFENHPEKILSINYDNNVFDNFVVSSCEQEDIVNSVFPPKQKDKYPDEEADSSGRPIISYLKYKTEDGKCYSRKYQYVNRKATAAKRFTPEEIDCPGKPGWLTHGEVAKFSDCRSPKLPLAKLVRGWSEGKPAWTPKDEEGKKHTRLLECTFDQFSKLYDLTCVKGDKENEYFLFVAYQQKTMDRFTVTSCDEEGVINGIFPVKETTANPKVFGMPWIQKIWFSHENGDCYKREYPHYIWIGPIEPAEKVKCPKAEKPDEWTNPSWGFAGQWRECTGPMSISEKAKAEAKKKLLEQPGHHQETNQENKHDENKAAVEE